jgi:transglutaminase-like putative cysteine protease
MRTKSRFVLPLAIALCSIVSSSCRKSDDVEQRPEKRKTRPIEPPPAPAPAPMDVDLGIGAYPRGTKTNHPTRFRFDVKDVDPHGYRAGYALAEAEHQDLRADYLRWAKSVGFQKVDSDHFHWHPPKGCSKGLACIFDAAARRDEADLAPLADLFRARSRAASLNSLQTAELVVAFVQSIKYEVPDEPFGLLPPALVASERRGDCDSKSLLAVVLLKKLGIDAVMIQSEAHHHTMFGIALPAPGAWIEFEGRRYAFTEATHIGWPIGQIDPKVTHPNDWHASKVHFAANKEKNRK